MRVISIYVYVNVGHLYVPCSINWQTSLKADVDMCNFVDEKMSQDEKQLSNTLHFLTFVNRWIES